MVVTVRVDFDDSRNLDNMVYENIRREGVLECYNKIVEDPDNISGDMAIILHVDGADIVAKCTYADSHRDDKAIEMF